MYGRAFDMCFRLLNNNFDDYSERKKLGNQIKVGRISRLKLEITDFKNPQAPKTDLGWAEI